MNWLKLPLRFVFVFAFSLAISFSALSASKDPSAPPAHQKVLGSATYVTMPLHRLAKPVLLWADFDFLAQRGVHRSQVLRSFGVAAPVEGESNASFLQDFITAYVDGNGGIGMNENFGSGRAATILQEWQIKGSGKTIMVNPNADGSHRNGASFIAEGIHEAIWSKLLAYELPYGAFRTVALIATGSDIAGEPRVLIVREDPLRPGHYVINPTAELMNDPRDAARIQEAMTHILEALPKPKGTLPKNRAARLKAQINEFIDRQAIQHGYAWTHSLFHAATSPSNAGMDGRTIDFGTYSAFDGYPNARIIDEDGFFGDTALYKQDLLKNIRDSWVRTVPQEMLAGLPSEEEWFERFESTFQKTRQVEILRLAGAFTELSEDLWIRAEGKTLAELLIKIAEAGNELPIEVWQGRNPFGTGTFQLGRVLAAAASVSLRNFHTGLPALVKALPDATLREKFVTAYSDVFKIQQTLAQKKGISISAESTYRRLSTRVRNKKMKTVFRTLQNEKVIWKLVAQYKVDGDYRPIQDHIDRTVAENRREFRDADPFTLVLEESSVAGQVHRTVFDSLSNRTGVLPMGVVPTEFLRVAETQSTPGLCASLAH